MKWIKASEVPDPGISKYYMVRNRISKQNGASVYIDKRTTLQDYCDSMHTTLDQLEWLDESPASLPKTEGKADDEIRNMIRRKFHEDTGVTYLNSQGEPDVEYMEYLEDKYYQASQSKTEGKGMIIEILKKTENGSIDISEQGEVKIQSHNSGHINRTQYETAADRILSAIPFASVDALRTAWEAFRMRGFPHNTDSYGNETFEQFLSSLNKQNEQK